MYLSSYIYTMLGVHDRDEVMTSTAVLSLVCICVVFAGAECSVTATVVSPLQN